VKVNISLAPAAATAANLSQADTGSRDAAQPDPKASSSSIASLAAALAEFFEIEASVLTLAGHQSGSISNGEAGDARGQSKKREKMRRAEGRRQPVGLTVGVTVPLLENRKVLGLTRLADEDAKVGASSSRI
jgi:hypothetical protein